MHRFIMLTMLSVVATMGYVQPCPDPMHSSLAYGEIPDNWALNPFSETRPQTDVSTRFVKANVLVAGLGQGVSCTYKNSLGCFSIWRKARTKIPSRMDSYWAATLGGYVCSESLTHCQFYIVVE